MAKVGNNIVTTGLSGKLGNLIVFRNRGGKTIVSKTPRKKEQEPSEAQEQHQLRFQEAILYGKTSITDPLQKAARQQFSEAVALAKQALQKESERQKFKKLAKKQKKASAYGAADSYYYKQIRTGESIN